jgi:integrase
MCRLIIRQARTGAPDRAGVPTLSPVWARRGAAQRHRLDRLSVAVVQSWLNSRSAAGDSIAKVHVMRTVLGAALTQAMREELVSRNVARLVTLPPNRPARQQPWSPNEALAFLRAARGDGLYAAFVLLLAYGLRRGEVLGLSWRDVDLDHGVVRVRQKRCAPGADFSLAR